MTQLKSLGESADLTTVACELRRRRQSERQKEEEDGPGFGSAALQTKQQYRRTDDCLLNEDKVANSKSW